MRSLLPPGCLPLLLLAALLMLPFFLADAMLSALASLGFGPAASLWIALGIFVGGMVNIPVTRIEHPEQVETVPVRLFGLDRVLPIPSHHRQYTVLAVNVGGCVIPGVIAGYELYRAAGEGVLTAALVAVAVNVAVCYFAARPVPNLGIAMSPLLPALAAAGCALLLAPEFSPPVAFAAGVLGPLIGADLLHLRDISKIGTGVASIGGAGTFDGIVLSSLVATLLA